jgi:hypothetical protein
MKSACSSNDLGHPFDCFYKNLRPIAAFLDNLRRDALCQVVCLNDDRVLVCKTVSDEDPRN